MADLVLFVHPYGHVFDEFVPMGAVALMNRVPGPKLGRYSWELTEEDLHQASVLAMDLHWYFSIEPVGWIAKAIRKIRPDLPIVLGGISASFYAKHLLETFEIDYLVQGDGEASFPALIDALRQGKEPPKLPNVWRRDSLAPQRQVVPSNLYNSNDYLTLDWFPSLNVHTRNAHKMSEERPLWGQMDNFHPYVPLNRGCRFPCGGCFGSYQPDVFGFGQVDRSAESFANLLDRAEADADYRFVNLTAGTEDMARIQSFRDVFSKKRKLSAYVMHFCALPSDDDLALILDGFENVCIDFTNPSDVPLPLRGSGMSTEDAEKRIQQIALMLDGRPEVRVGVSFMDTKPHPFKDKLRAVDWETIELKENSEWALPRPSTDLFELPDSTLPVMPVPRVERIGLSAEELLLRERAKSAQAEQFRDVSRGHARYIVARALVPSFHPIFEEAPMQHVDGKPREALQVTDAALCAFMDTFTSEFRRWFVRRLAKIEVLVSVITEEVKGLTQLVSLGDDIGTVSLTPGIDGVNIHWSGSVEKGSKGLVLRVVMDPGDGTFLDPASIPGLAWRVLPLSGKKESVEVKGVFSQNHSKMSLTCDDEISELRWSPLRDYPDSPFEPKVRAKRTDGGPSNLVESPWPDMRWPGRITRFIDLAVKRDHLAGWHGTLRRRSMRWVRYEFTHPNGGAAEIYIIPPGKGSCAWQGQNMRLLFKKDIPSDLMAKLTPLLSALDQHG